MTFWNVCLSMFCIAYIENVKYISNKKPETVSIIEDRTDGKTGTIVKMKFRTRDLCGRNKYLGEIERQQRRRRQQQDRSRSPAECSTAAPENVTRSCIDPYPSTEDSCAGCNPTQVARIDPSYPCLPSPGRPFRRPRQDADCNKKESERKSTHELRFQKMNITGTTAHGLWTRRWKITFSKWLR